MANLTPQDQLIAWGKALSGRRVPRDQIRLRELPDDQLALLVPDEDGLTEFAAMFIVLLYFYTDPEYYQGHRRSIPESELDDALRAFGACALMERLHRAGALYVEFPHSLFDFSGSVGVRPV